MVQHLNGCIYNTRTHLLEAQQHNKRDFSIHLDVAHNSIEAGDFTFMSPRRLMNRESSWETRHMAPSVSLRVTAVHSSYNVVTFSRA